MWQKVILAYVEAEILELEGLLTLHIVPIETLFIFLN